MSLFTASTGKIISRLADRSIHADRRRNLFIITTIAFASCLIMTLALYVYGGTYQNVFRRQCPLRNRGRSLIWRKTKR